MKAEVSVEVIATLVWQVYGLRVSTCRQLPGYEDLNFHITVSTDTENCFIPVVLSCGYTLKILNSESPQTIPVTEGHHLLIEHLRHGGIHTPAPVRSRSGASYDLAPLPVATARGGMATFLVRLFHYAPGRTLHETGCSQVSMEDIGRLAGHVDKLLSEFQNEALKSYVSKWRMSQVSALSPLVDQYLSGDGRRLGHAVIQAFDNLVTPRVSGLQTGVIHGDMSSNNMVLRQTDDPQKEADTCIRNIVTILDVGDASFSCYIYELATTIANFTEHCSNDVGPLSVAREISRGFTREFALNETEIAVLQTCICARLLQLQVLGLQQLAGDQDNDYVREDTVVYKGILEEIWNIQADTFISSVFGSQKLP